MNFTEIAEIVGYASRGAAYDATMRAMNRETLENVDEIRSGELSRIGKMIEASWPTATVAIATANADGEPLDPKLLNAIMQNQLQAQATVSSSWNAEPNTSVALSHPLSSVSSMKSRLKISSLPTSSEHHRRSIQLKSNW
jgi:hypothetical protein